MNGAPAEPCVNTTSRPSSASISTMGPSHHFFRTRMKAHNSPRMPHFSRDSSKAMTSPSVTNSLVQLEQRPPVHVLAQGRLLLLVEKVVAQHQVVHVRAH